MWKDVSPNAIELVKKLLEADDEKRIKAVTALNDKWLLNITKARRNNQMRILNQQVILNLKLFIVTFPFTLPRSNSGSTSQSAP